MGLLSPRGSQITTTTVAGTGYAMILTRERCLLVLEFFFCFFFDQGIGSRLAAWDSRVDVVWVSICVSSVVGWCSYVRWCCIHVALYAFCMYPHLLCNVDVMILSRPICDTILKRLEGPTKDRTAYWYAFARWISLHQHYIIDGDTYKRHGMPHEYNNTSYTIASSDYGWNTNRNSNDIHPASPGCRPGTYPLIEEAEEELQIKKHRSRVMIIA